MNSKLDAKTLLITGGTGSFGQALARQLLLTTSIKKVIIFSRDECKQWQMREQDPLFNDPRLHFLIGDIRDLSRLKEAFQGVDIVIHSAALKQVPLAEEQPYEFVKTNILGSQNIITAAQSCGVKQVIALSTDKAVNPYNLYGASKLCSEKLFVAASSSTRFSVARYGNVLMSRGSVIPYWKKLIDQGATELPLTDPNMTRFWLSLEQAVSIVIYLIHHQIGSEILVPKIPSMNMAELAKAIAPQLKTKIIGKREGEKLHEYLIGQDEAHLVKEFKQHFLIVPKAIKKSIPGEDVKANFSYNSKDNPQKMSAEELLALLSKESPCQLTPDLTPQLLQIS